MKLKPIILSAILLMATHALAQPVQKSKVPIWLNLGVGANVADCFDKGTVPYSYLGAGANLNAGATVEWRRCHVQTEARTFFNILMDFGGYAFTIDSRTEFLYRIHDNQRDRLHLWVGGGIQTFYDIKENPSMMNASLGASIFENLCAEGMLQYDFAFIREGSHNLLTAYGKLTLPLTGLAIRPGFAYMDNYTSDINLANTLLGDYETFVKFLPGIGTDIGLTLNLLNGNRIGFNYRWDYLSTGHQGAYRYDNAFHSINANFMFKLN